MDDQLDISSIRKTLDDRFDKIVDYSQTILDLKIKLKESEVENLKLRKKINDLYSQLAKRHS